MLCYIPSSYLSYNQMFVPLIAFIKYPLLTYLASGNHKSDHFFYDFVFEIQLTCNTMLVPGTAW